MTNWTPERIAAARIWIGDMLPPSCPAEQDEITLARLGLVVVDPTDADVERVAKALAWREWRLWRPDPLAWESRDPATLRYWRDNARAAIAALGERAAASKDSTNGK
jgi:hypothetical protein